MKVASAREVADFLGVSLDKVYEMAQDDEIPQLRSIGSRLRFDLEAIEEWMAKVDQS